MTQYQQSIQKVRNNLHKNNFSNALKLLTKYNKKFPNDAEIKRLSGVVQIHLKRLTLAEKSLKQSLAIHKDNIPALLNLASLYKQQNKLQQALATIEIALSKDPNHIAALFNQGNLYRSLEQWDHASKCYLRVIDNNPHHLNALVALGLLKKNAGEIKLSIEFFHRALNIDPFNKAVYLALANLKNYVFSKAEIRQVTQIIEQSEDIESIELLFAKAQHLEHEGKYSAAFDYLTRANETHAKKINRIPFDWPNYTRRIIDIFDRQEIPKNQNNSNSKTPLFIVSMPRSGSTLVEQILASHPAIYGASEIPTWPQQMSYIKHQTQIDFPENWPHVDKKHNTRISEEYLNKINSFEGDFSFVSDKNLNNFNYIGAILSTMPNSIFIHCIREPMDVCLSCYKQLFNEGQEYSYSLKELAEYYNHHEAIMTFWKKQYPTQIFTVSYEHLIEHTENDIKEMLNFLNLPWNAACLEFHNTKRIIKTASAAQVTQKVYKDAKYRYKQYGELLNPLKGYLNSN